MGKYTELAPPGERLDNFLTSIISSLASPSLDYVQGKDFDKGSVIESLTGRRITDWADVVKARYPEMNPKIQKVYGMVLNMLLDPTNLVPMGAMMGEIKNVYHGSPHLFEAFDLSKIGGGEGAQAYGHGLYFAGKKEVAEFYRNALASAGNSYKYLDKIYTRNFKDPEYQVLNKISKNGKDDAVGFFEAMVKHEEDASKRSVFKKQLDFAKKVDEKAIEPHQNTGHLYDVNLLPDEDDLLLWDKPLSQQPERVKKAISEDPKLDAWFNSQARRNAGIKLADMAPWEDTDSVTGGDFYKSLADMIGRDLFERSGGAIRNEPDYKSASEYLNKLGIKGNKYLDGTSRAKGEGNYNYVIFSDKDIKINKRTSE